MTRTKLDAGLQELRMQMMQAGSHAEDSLAKTLKAVETGNHALLLLIIEADEYSIWFVVKRRVAYGLGVAC